MSKLKMKMVWKGVLLVALITVGAIVWMRYTTPEFAGHPHLASAMLYKYTNPVPTPAKLEIYSTDSKGEKESFRGRKPGKRRLKFETRNEAIIGSLVAAMREGADKDVRWPPEEVVTYHIYFESPGSKAPLYYMFFYRTGTNESSALTAYTTVGNHCDGEAVERWFETNGLLRTTGKE